MNNQWQKVKIEKGRYRNKQELVGYQETNPYYKAKKLYPALPETKGLFEQVLTNLQLVSESCPAVQTGYKIFKLPQHRFDGVTEQDYQIVDRLESLKTTLVTYVVIPKNPNGPNRPNPPNSSIHYYYTPGKKTTLAEIVKRTSGVSRSESPDVKEKSSALNRDALYSNFGFYLTSNLIGGPSAPHPVPWAHNTRYPQKFHLPSNLYPFLGFYYISPPKDPNSPNDPNSLSATFQGFNRSLVGITHSGQLEIIPSLPISSYEVHFDKDTKPAVKIIDPPDFPNLPNSPILLTPNLSTPEIEKLKAKIEQSYWMDDSWQKFAPYVGESRSNLFITNKGNGHHPEDYITAVWEGRCSLPAFGAVLSLSKEHFNKLFGSTKSFKETFLNKKVFIIPHSSNLEPRTYNQIYGSFAPLVLNGEYLFDVDRDSIMHRLRQYGNFTSPLEMLGQETKTLAPFIREPKNVLFETENFFGNILFSGRYELSIGASLIDLTHITSLLVKSLALNKELKHALVLDSGSAARVVFARNGKLHPLNIVAPGARNAIGDPSGNFYSGLRIVL